MTKNQQKNNSNTCSCLWCCCHDVHVPERHKFYVTDKLLVSHLAPLMTRGGDRCRCYVRSVSTPYEYEYTPHLHTMINCAENCCVSGLTQTHSFMTCFTRGHVCTYSAIVFILHWSTTCSRRILWKSNISSSGKMDHKQKQTCVMM